MTQIALSISTEQLADALYRARQSRNGLGVLCTLFGLSQEFDYWEFRMLDEEKAIQAVKEFEAQFPLENLLDYLNMYETHKGHPIYLALDAAVAAERKALQPIDQLLDKIQAAIESDIPYQMGKGI